jgi:hypothetical protein
VPAAEIVAGRVHKDAGVKNKTRPAPKQDIVTLADLAPRHRVTGGSERRVFGTDSHLRTLEENAMATKKSPKDLPAKTPVKGGRLIGTTT